MADESRPVVVEIRVKQLFGRFDHQMVLPTEKDFAIVVGPNGVGKTKLLELAHAALSWHLHKLTRVRFDELLIRYSDGASFRFVQVQQSQLPGFVDENAPPLGKPSLLLSAELPGQVAEEIPLLSDERSSRHLAHLVDTILESSPPDPSVRRLVTELRRGRNISEILSTIDNLGLWELLPDIEAEAFGRPEACAPYFGSGRSYLIETQRLVRVEPLTGLNDFPPRQRGVEHQRPRPAVLRHATDLAQKIGALDAQSGRLGQNLDRSFPKRLLDRSRPLREFAEIERDYERQLQLRGRLEQIGLLDSERGGFDTLDLRSDVDQTERRVLQTWLEDSAQKLDLFTELLDRVELLQSILNEKFLYKTIQIDREAGMRAVADGGATIPLTQLSSGEQHELVLLYDLLFNVHSDSLVMIDEPELSLHVSWQRRFIEDMLSISHLRRNRFIVATHSPQIVDRWGESLVELEGGWD